MMKRWIALLAALALLAAATSALAEITIPAEQYTTKLSSDARADWDDLVAGGVRSEISRSMPSSSGLQLPEITDKVTIGKDGSIQVVADDVSMLVYTPFGMVAFTQDVLAQLDTYAMVNDPGAFAENLKTLGIHIYMVDLMTKDEVYVSTSQNVVSSIVSDLDALSAADLESLIDAVASLEPDAYIYTRLCGNHKYLVYDYRANGSGTVIYTAVKNSRNIDFMYLNSEGVLTSDEIDNMEYLLADTVLDAA